jgi:hypothetical protein
MGIMQLTVCMLDGSRSGSVGRDAGPSVIRPPALHDLLLETNSAAFISWFGRQQFCTWLILRTLHRGIGQWLAATRSLEPMSGVWCLHHAEWHAGGR